ncbi:16S rRNA pseudouridine(516) synthase [Paenibacillus sp. FSL H8-0548]|uniref:pseudouridine synthase n=1 Tax=Paenibacillus sp. FSL H8-0548 TaxID=1920422 RepID=UPI00096E9B0C|nr:pseudouridine synthase [Paenibacillus sp. FSL H8-0548]OMF22409.1 16S rRNA pseudouridine(516) synthase [Paenibacillus sp. FSL H8-0548]
MSKKIRIDKLLAHMGLGTRSEIKRAVKLGKVTFAGKVIKDSGLIVDSETTEVAFEGTPVVYQELVYFMLNKPQGVISATEDGRERTVIDLLEPQDRLREPFPVGRLDKDTVGLLLLTNDGQLAHELLSPRKHVAKTYEAIVQGKVGEDDKQSFAAGVALDDGYMTMPAVLEIREYEMRENEVFSSIALTIMEGKFHQVKRMFEAVDKTVVYLKRAAMGPLKLDESLPEGAYRELTNEEIELLRSHKRAAQ